MKAEGALQTRENYAIVFHETASGSNFTHYSSLHPPLPYLYWSLPHAQRGREGGENATPLISLGLGPNFQLGHEDFATTPQRVC